MTALPLRMALTTLRLIDGSQNSMRRVTLPATKLLADGGFLSPSKESPGGWRVALVSLQEFLDSLAACPGPTALPAGSNSAGVTYVEAVMDAFVAPNLSDAADLENPSDPNVIVVSAAGAVGKTTLAKEIARAKAAPYWNLAAGGPVGQNSLHGMFATTFGAQVLPTLYQRVSQGQLFFVIDALDEARVKVNEQAFEAFIQDVAGQASSVKGVVFLLFGRTQIAETTWLLLADRGVRTGLYVIEPFTRDQANAYIEKRIRSGGGRGAKLVEDHRAPLAEARDLLFKHLERALQQEPKAAAAFLGYAPVLDSMSVLLGGESNLKDLIERLRRAFAGANGSTRGGYAGILDLVVRRILDREHAEKLVENIKPTLQSVATAHKWSSWEQLYTPDEQCRRLLAVTMGIQGIDVPLSAPSALKAQYERQLAAWLPEHPFLRDGRNPANTVFESYLYARALHKDYGVSSEAVARRVADPAYKPSSLFADFYFLMHDEIGAPAVPPAHIGWLYEALLSAGSDSFFVRFSLDGPDPLGPAEADHVSEVDGEFTFYSVPAGADAAPAVRSREFVTRLRRDDVITLSRYVRDASIVVPCTLVLGTGSSDFEIGPGVNISCRELRLSAETVVVGGRTRSRAIRGEEYDDAVVLEAAVFSGTVTARPVTHVPFRVSWPGGNVFPWTDFYGVVGAEVGGDPRLHEAFRRFRRIIMTLRSHGRGGLARYHRKIEHARVLKGALGEALLQRLLTDRLLRLEDGFYHWAPDVASKVLGVSWLQLRKGQASPTLSAYLQRFVADNASLF